MKIIKVLILFANPKKTQKLQTLQEEEVIKESLNLAKYKNKLEITFIRASTIHDMRRHLLNDNYHVVHISSHGTEGGLILEGENGEAHRIPIQALADWLRKYDSLECLLLNACYSLSQGILTSLSVPFTIAIEGKLFDQAAIEFSRGFYDALLANRDYEFAYGEGCDNVKLCFSEIEFRAEILKKGAVSRDSKIVKKKKTEIIKTFTNIWFTPKKYSLWAGRNPSVGTIYVYNDHLKFESSEIDMRFSEIRSVKHMKMGGDINNNWVEIIYQANGSKQSAYFAEASKLGLGNLIGGSHELFELLRQNFPNTLLPDESLHSPKSSEPSTGTNVNVNGGNNVTSGGSMSDNQIVFGNVTFNSTKEE